MKVVLVFDLDVLDVMLEFIRLEYLLYETYDLLFFFRCAVEFYFFSNFFACGITD